MEQQTTTIIAFGGFLLSLASLVIGAINHKRIRSSCCGKKLEATLDIEATTPPLPKVQKIEATPDP